MAKDHMTLGLVQLNATHVVRKSLENGPVNHYALFFRQVPSLPSGSKRTPIIRINVYAVNISGSFPRIMTVCSA